MKHPIDPKVDCVFKALLGTQENANLLISFINAIIGDTLESPITSVDIIDPHNAKETRDDKLSIVDVKAKDNHNNIYQIEVQVEVFPSTPARMLYTWSDVYSKQLQSGNDFDQLKSTYSIWLLYNAISDNEHYVDQYHMQNKSGRLITPHGGIWAIELNKFTTIGINNETERWLTFFQKAETLYDQDLPNWMQTTEMRQAMSTLKRFSDKEREYHKYQSRQNYLREQSCIKRALEDSAKRINEQTKRADGEATRADEQAKRADNEAKKASDALQREESALQREEAALAKLKELEALLAKQNTPTNDK